MNNGVQAAQSAAVNTVAGAVNSHTTPTTLIQPGTVITNTGGNTVRQIGSEAYITTRDRTAGYQAAIAGKNEQGQTTYEIKAGYDLKDKAQLKDFANLEANALHQQATAAKAKAIPEQAATQAATGVAGAAVQETTQAVRSGIQNAIGGIFKR